MRQLITYSYLWSLIVVALVSAGCVATPVPEPPLLDPPKTELVDVNYTRGDKYQLTGNRGSATENALIWVVNLDSLDPPVLATITDDGSFVVTVEGEIGHELRLQVRQGDARSEPVDTIIRDDGGLREVIRQDCLSLEPAFDLDFGTVTVSETTPGFIEVSNRCGVELTIDDLRLRVEPAPFFINTAPPLSIPDRGAATIELGFTPGGPGQLEEILFLELSAPFTERRPVTLIGVGAE